MTEDLFRDPSLRVRSVESTLKLLKGGTTLFKHIPCVPLTEMTPDVRFLGVTYSTNGSGDTSEDAAGVTSLLWRLDNSLFHGGHDGIDGLYQMSQHDYHESAGEQQAFYDAVDANPALKLFAPPVASWLKEGNLPHATGYVVALDPQAVRWNQLLPAMSMDLVPLPFDFDSTREIQSRRKRHRSCALIYGYLELLDPDGLLVLHRSSFHDTL